MAVVPGAFSVNMLGVIALSTELRLIRSRLKPAMRMATAASAKNVQAAARASIKSQTTGKTTGWYPASITWEMQTSNASLALAVVGPERDNAGKKPTMGLILEFGTSRQAPKPHLTPAGVAEFDNFETNIADAVALAVLP